MKRAEWADPISLPTLQVLAQAVAPALIFATREVGLVSTPGLRHKWRERKCDRQESFGESAKAASRNMEMKS
ncbi:MAG: hypothetical protein ACRD2B_02575 [Terriglobia bacterium]